MGVVSPVGNDIESYWRALREGRSGIRAIDHFDASELPSRIAGIAEDVELADMSRKDIMRRDRYVILALGAADQAWKHSGLDISKEDPFRCGVVIGTGIGGLYTIQEQVGKFTLEGAKRVSPLMVPKVLTNMAAGEVGIRLGLMGPNKAIITACASGTQSIGEAASIIRAGVADIMVAGGAEASVVGFGIAGFGAMKALSTRNDDPLRASRPFDLDRDGFVMGEGAGLLVLESEEHAKARGAEIYAEVLGHGETCDAYHVTAPSPDGRGAAEAMKAALRDASMNPEDIGYFNAHGTSTKYNEIGEAKALALVFGQDTMPPVSSTKSMTGHLLGAAGAVEAIACVMSIRDGVLPPNINYDTPDPECIVNIIANEAREAKIKAAMSNSLGFGGHNASVIVARYE
jgi:3-oxoacyl-[acyl-carrier-protein] synthase II